MSDPTFRDDPVANDQRIGELYAWIGTHANDGEGIIGGVITIDGKRSFMPLVSGRRHVVEAMRGLADQVVSMGKALSRNPPVGAQLVTFRRVEAGELQVADALRLMLDMMDYERGACGPNEMVGACIPTELLARCRTALSMRDMPPGSESWTNVP